MSTTTSASSNAARFLADSNPPFCGMDVAKSFSLLTEKEKLYTYWVSKVIHLPSSISCAKYHYTETLSPQASWAGVPIIQGQWSPHAQDLFKLILLVFSSEKGKFADLNEIKKQSGVSDEAWLWALEYSAQVASILLNYKSFGFSKFVPRVSPSDFKAIVKSSPQGSEALKLWDAVSSISSCDRCIY